MSFIKVINNSNYINHLSRKDHIIYVSPEKENADKLINALFKHFLCDKIYLYSPSKIEISGYESEEIDPLYEIYRPLEVYFFIDQTSPIRPDIEFVKYTINNNFNKAHYIDIDETGNITGSSYQCPNINRKKILFLFPGPIYPLSMGSHRRAFEMLSLFYKQGYDVDLLLTGGDRESVRNKLRCVSSGIYFYDTIKLPDFKENPRRRLYKNLSSSINISSRYPETLQERTTRVSKSASPIFSELINKFSYDAVYFNYLWFSDLASKCKRTQRICDLHDIMFKRNETKHNRFSKRLFSDRRAKSYELAAIKRMNKVISISKRDHEILVKEKMERYSVFIPNDYSIPFIKSQHTRVNTPMRFGFIGSAMDANEQALNLILTKFWPTITANSPNAKLMIAGAIGNNESTIRNTYFNSEIEILGFVDSLQKFYESIDFLISPVAVAGGMNIKNVEATMAGTVVITNNLGAEAFQAIEWPFIANNGKEAVALIRKLKTKDGYATEQLSNLQGKLIQEYENQIDNIEDKLFGT